MSDLLNSYTFEAKKIVYYSVTVGANIKQKQKELHLILNIANIMKRLIIAKDMNIR